VGLHLKNIYEDGELTREATTEESSVVQMEGGREVQRPVTLFKLEAIVADEADEAEIKAIEDKLKRRSKS